jgi:NifB/MoaA-like Fe-S oxidoreductase
MISELVIEIRDVTSVDFVSEITVVIVLPLKLTLSVLLSRTVVGIIFVSVFT